jgi:GT2 family glycosyltransferase
MLKEFDVQMGPGMFIKRTALATIGYRNESVKYTGDLDVSFRLALLGDITHVKGFLATHRVHGQAASLSGKGDVMASEVVRLAKMSLESPLLPRSLLHEKSRILGYAYLISSHYTKIRGPMYYKQIAKALFADPSLLRHGLSQAFLIRKKIGGICYRAWLRLPLTFRVSMLRNLKKAWRVCPWTVKHEIRKIVRFFGFNL